MPSYLWTLVEGNVVDNYTAQVRVDTVRGLCGGKALPARYMCTLVEGNMVDNSTAKG